MDDDQPIHLKQRDRSAFAYRVAGAICGLALFAVAFSTSSWDDRWMIALIAIVTVAGALSCHVRTSVVRCPRCASRVMNFRISDDDAARKQFVCRSCDTSAYLTEGFSWQRDFSG